MKIERRIHCSDFHIKLKNVISIMRSRVEINRVIRKHRCKCLLRKRIHPPNPNHVIIASANNSTVTGIADDMSNRSLVTLDPEVNATVSPVEHDQGTVLTSCHQDVLVYLSSCLYQEELYRLIFPYTNLGVFYLVVLSGVHPLYRSQKKFIKP